MSDTDTEAAAAEALRELVRTHAATVETADATDAEDGGNGKTAREQAAAAFTAHFRGDQTSAPPDMGEALREAAALLDDGGDGDADADADADANAKVAAAEAVLARAAGWPVLRSRREWDGEPEERDWLVDGWLPAGRLAMLSGPGEAGKSRLALQLAAAMAGGGGAWIDACGGPPAPPVACGPAVIASWEDEPDEVHRRLRKMVDAKQLRDGRGLHLLDMMGEGALWQPAEGGSGHVATLGALTDTGAAVRRYCERAEARLLVVDTLAGAYACSENDRSLVRAFTSSFDLWARDAGCAVLLIAHPPKGDGVAYSGSTDWHGSARALWRLWPEETGLGERITGDGDNKRKPLPAPGMRLEVIKSNYARKPDPLWLGGWPRWASVTAEAARDDLGGLRSPTAAQSAHGAPAPALRLG